MKTRPLAVALLVTLTSPALMPPRAALAQSADDATTRMARQRFQEGVAYYDKGNYELARAAFLQAYALRKHPAVLLNLAQSSVKSGHALEAARYFQQFLHEHTSATDAQRTDANRGLNEARTKLGRIDVSGVAAGTEIFLDDERVGVTPLDRSIDAEPGTHTVRAHGAIEQSVQVTTGAGQSATARFGPPAAAAAPPPPVAPAEPPPPMPEPVQPPPTEPVPDATAPIPPPVEEAHRQHDWTLAIVGGSIFVLSAGAAIWLGLEKQSAQDSANSAASDILAHGGGTGTCVNPTATYAGPCAALGTDNDHVNTDATFANVALGVAIASFAVTTAGIVLGAIGSGEASSPPAGSSSNKPATSAIRPTVLPWVGRGVGGMSVGATF